MLRKAEREEDGYASIAVGYDALHRAEQERKVRFIITHLPLVTDEKLLDVGCGTGFSLGLWPCRDVTGAEPSSAMIRQAPPNVQGRILQLRAEDLSVFDDHEFDVVVSVTAIHNFTDIALGLREMKRVGRRKFAFSVLRQSAKLGEIDRLVRKYFLVQEVIEDTHDRIYLAW